MMTSAGPDRESGRASRVFGRARRRAGRFAFGALALCGLLGCAGGTRVRLGEAPVAAVPAGRITEVARLTLPESEGGFAPTVLGLDGTGRLYATDAARGRVAVFDEREFAGFLEPPTASTGSAGRLSDVRGIASSVGGLAVYVLDGGRGRLYGYDLGLRFRGVALDLADPAVGVRFGRVEADGVSFDPSGRVFLSDREGDRLLVFDQYWRPESEIGGPGSAGRGFFDPGALTAVRGGDIGVADRGNRTVQIVTPGGRFGATLALPRAAESLASAGAQSFLVGDAAGDVWLADAAEARRLLAAPPGVGGPAWVVQGAAGDRFYVARPGAGHILVYAWNDTRTMP